MTFFGANNDDGVLGIAYVGAVCSRNDRNKMSINDWTNRESTTGLIVAHELGNGSFSQIYECTRTLSFFYKRHWKFSTSCVS